MINRVDLVMWTKNGAETLPLVLKRISEVIPNKFINKRIIVDDGSTDNTREIARDFGWQVIFNEGKGISDGANTALKHVTSEYFISFEQDLLLAHDWWQKIPTHLSSENVIIASGTRLTAHLPVLRKIEEYALERYKKAHVLGKDYEKFLCSKNLDNTIYKTDALKKLGGFPRLAKFVGVESALASKVASTGYQWKVDFNVKSVHLRKSLKEELAHRYWYGSCWKEGDPWIKPFLLRFLFSPFRGLDIAIKKKTPQTIYIYPLLRFYTLKGVTERRKQGPLANKEPVVG